MGEETYRQIIASHLADAAKRRMEEGRTVVAAAEARTDATIAAIRAGISVQRRSLPQTLGEALDAASAVPGSSMDIGDVLDRASAHPRDPQS